MEPSVDDLLSFKEFPLIQEGNSTSAQLNIDSPKKVSPVRETETPPEGLKFFYYFTKTEFKLLLIVF